MEEFELRAPRDRSRSGELRFTGTIVEEPGTSNPRRPEVELPFRDRAQTENPNASSSGVTRRRAAERINSSGLREVTPDRLRRGEGPGVMKTVAAQIRGFYLLKFAVSVTACYLTIQLLRKFAEVLLPFIFAVLVTIILEPLKKFVMRVLCRLVVRVFLALHMDFCVDGVQMTGTGNRHPSIDSMGMEGQPIYGSLPEDSEDMNAPSTRASMPAPTVKKLLIALSIFYCLAFSARVFWLVARVFLRAAAGISQDMQYYKEGAARLKSWMKEYISGLHIESLDFNDVLDELLHEVENLGTVLTQSLLNFMVQGVVTFIFLIYMLWSPVKMDGSAMATEAFHSTSRYLKVKFGISAFTGLTMGLLLFTMGLDLPAAFGLLSFLCNFLPGIGSLVASIMPCMLSIIDVRKAPMQVAVAFIMQMFVHFLIDFLVEPVVFGISVEMNSVIVILGIWFFYQVWGVPGMLLSVPLLAVVRIMIKSVKFPNAGGDDDTAAFFDGVFAGRWMSSVGEPRGEEDIDDYHSEVHPKDEGRVDATVPVCGEIQRYEDLWTMLMESQLAQELRQMYLQRQLTYDFGFLVFITLGLTLIQV